MMKVIFEQDGLTVTFVDGDYQYHLSSDRLPVLGVRADIMSEIAQAIMDNVSCPSCKATEIRRYPATLVCGDCGYGWTEGRE